MALTDISDSTEPLACPTCKLAGSKLSSPPPPTGRRMEGLLESIGDEVVCPTDGVGGDSTTPFPATLTTPREGDENVCPTGDDEV